MFDYHCNNCNSLFDQDEAYIDNYNEVHSDEYYEPQSMIYCPYCSSDELESYDSFVDEVLEDSIKELSNKSNYEWTIDDTQLGDIRTDTYTSDDETGVAIHILIDIDKDSDARPEVSYKISGNPNIFYSLDEVVENLPDLGPAYYKDSITEDLEDDIQEIGQEFTSANTSINSSKLPAIFNMVNFEPNTVNIDYGGGKFDNVAEYLKQFDVINLVYDPYNRSQQHNKDVIKLVQEHGGADSATCSNVLNVIKEPEVRKNVLSNIKKLVKANGKVYITVYEGTGQGNEGPTKSGYQLNRKTDDYMEEIKEIFPDAQRKGKLIVATAGQVQVESMNKNYFNLVKDIMKVADNDGSTLFKEYNKGLSSPVDILKDLGYVQDDPDSVYMYKEMQDGYAIIFSFDDYDEKDIVKYFVVDSSDNIPDGWTVTKMRLEENLKEEKEMNESEVRKYSNILTSMIEDDLLDAKFIATAFIQYLSEDDVKDFIDLYGLLDEDDDLEEDLNEGAHYDHYDNRISSAGYSDVEIEKVLSIADEYIDEATPGVISKDQIEKYGKLMGLKDMSDSELRRTWDLYHDVISREAFSEDSENIDNYKKYSDCASAFAEIINQEARRRKATGNYDPDNT